jgi:hypothetical protein
MAAAEKEEKKPVMSCASSRHTTNLKQSILELSISMIRTDYIPHNNILPTLKLAPQQCKY